MNYFIAGIFVGGILGFLLLALFAGAGRLEKKN